VCGERRDKPSASASSSLESSIPEYSKVDASTVLGDVKVTIEIVRK
jgi:hypothetical protein